MSQVAQRPRERPAGLTGLDNVFERALKDSNDVAVSSRSLASKHIGVVIHDEDHQLALVRLVHLAAASERRHFPLEPAPEARIARVFQALRPQLQVSVQCLLVAPVCASARVCACMCVCGWVGGCAGGTGVCVRVS